MNFFSKVCFHDFLLLLSDDMFGGGEALANTAQLLESTYGTTCYELNQLKGPAGVAAGQRGGRLTISRFYLSPLST